MRFTASEIASITNGTLVGPDTTCTGASIDTRTLVDGQLFVPLVDSRDGHDFIPMAITGGCAAYLTEREAGEGTAIVVDNTYKALTALGQAARAKHDGPVIGITGSVGKTSVKDLALAAIKDSRRTYASEKSFNNEIGVPLTLINAPDGTEVLIVEMGARGIGHIADLCAIARPTVGIVTYVGAVHTSEFGTIEQVAKAKAELVESLPADGTAILNGDCAPVLAMAGRGAASTVVYGADADVAAIDVAIDAELRPSFTALVGGERYPVTLPTHGVHQVSNALAAIAAASAIGVPPGDAAMGLASARTSPWRMELLRAPSGAVVINDAYNANAISTEAALRSLAALEASSRLAVLGVMAELGDRHDGDHQAMAALCVELDIELVAYREAAYGVAVANDFDQVVDRLGPLDASHAVLVKGSRVAGLEALAERLAGSATTAT